MSDLYIVEDRGYTSPCWIWQGSINPDGYGKRSGKYAHRIMYEKHIGAIPIGLQIDHLCRITSCVNPAHLEAVTHTENIRRRVFVTPPICVHGHPFDATNTYRPPGSTRRQCRVCNRIAVDKYKAKRKSA